MLATIRQRRPVGRLPISDTSRHIAVMTNVTLPLMQDDRTTRAGADTMWAVVLPGGEKHDMWTREPGAGTTWEARFGAVSHCTGGTEESRRGAAERTRRTDLISSSISKKRMARSKFGGWHAANKNSHQAAS